MKKKITCAVLLLCFTLLKTNAQILAPQTINSNGNYKSNGTVILEDALGSLAASTISTSTFMYTQGFIQPDAGTTSGPLYVNDVTLSSGGGLDNAGNTFINGNIMLEFTIGEYASKTINSPNNLLTQGILQPYGVVGPLPVTGLEFYAKRINNNTVQLDWKTVQEINNKGFHIERRKENESNFAEVAFTTSSANGGNSSSSLSYAKTDANNFTGNTYYRLKQEDKDGRSTYSVIRIVKGDAAKQLAMQVWPVPATGPVNVVVNGLSSPDMLQVFDVNGRLMKQQAIQNNSQVQLTNLTPGTYMLRLAENKDAVQRIIIQ